MEIVGDLEEDVPYYEKYLFNDMFENNCGGVVLDKSILRHYNININDLIFEKCRLKWYCNVKCKGFQKMSQLKEILERTGISLLFLVAFLYLFNAFVVFMLLLGCFFLVFIVVYVALSCHVFHKKYSFILTDKWKSILSEIYWYKFYLERCKEEEINANLWENEVYSWDLPYAIALKLNRKIIDELL